MIYIVKAEEKFNNPLDYYDNEQHVDGYLFTTLEQAWEVVWRNYIESAVNTQPYHVDDSYLYIEYENEKFSCSIETYRINSGEPFTL